MGGIINCVAFFLQILPNIHFGTPFSKLSSLEGAVGSTSAWHTRGVSEPVLMRYIFSGKYPVLSGRLVTLFTII